MVTIVCGSGEGFNVESEQKSLHHLDSFIHVAATTYPEGSVVQCYRIAGLFRSRNFSSSVLLLSAKMTQNHALNAVRSTHANLIPRRRVLQGVWLDLICGLICENQPLPAYQRKWDISVGLLPGLTTTSRQINRSLGLLALHCNASFDRPYHSTGGVWRPIKWLYFG